MKKIFFLLSFFFATGIIMAQSVSGVVTNASCNGGSNGSIDVTVTGGVPPFTYFWSNSATTQDIVGLAAGIYTITVTGSNGGSSVKGFQVNQPAFGVGINTSAMPVSCFNGSNGSIDMTVWGGTPPYWYSWSNGASWEDPANLAAGTYFVTVTDANGCIQTGAASVGQPAPLQVTTTTNPANCSATGSAMATGNGGTVPYSFKWSNGATSQAISGLTAGTYTVTLTDANGCTTSTTAVITGGGAGINPTVTGTCDGAIVTNLPQGTYNVTITNASGCTATATFNVGGQVQTWYKDQDGDGFGNPAQSIQSCTQPSGYVLQAGDCNDNNSNIHPGATELCNGVDDNCDGILPANELDADSDGWSICEGDCNDANAQIYPGATEVANNVDDNCNGQVDEGTAPPCTPPNAAFIMAENDYVTSFLSTSTGTAPMSFEWNFGDGFTSTEEDPTHTYANTGVYVIKLKVTNACGQDSRTDVLTVIGGNPTPVTEPGSEDRGPIEVYPNPTLGPVNIEGPAGLYMITAPDGRTKKIIKQ